MEQEIERQRQQLRNETTAALANQLKEKEASREQEYQQFLKEKAMIDEIVKKIQDEDARTAVEKMKLRQTRKEDIDHYLDEKEKIKQLLRQREEEENKKIMEYLAEMEEREKTLKEDSAEKKAFQEVRNKVYEQLAKNREEQEKRKVEYESLKLEVEMAEQEERDMAQEQALFEKRIKDREDYKRQMDQFAREKREREERRKQEDEKYVKILTQQLEEAAKLDQLSVQKARMRREELKVFTFTFLLNSIFSEKFNAMFKNEKKALNVKNKLKPKNWQNKLKWKNSNAKLWKKNAKDFSKNMQKDYLAFCLQILFKKFESWCQWEAVNLLCHHSHILFFCKNSTTSSLSCILSIKYELHIPLENNIWVFLFLKIALCSIVYRNSTPRVEGTSSRSLF
jgi:hypothetical protein